MTALPPPPVDPQRWLRLEPKRDPHNPDTGVLDAVAKAIRAEQAQHPANATCACITIKAIEKFAEFGYELVSADDLAWALHKRDEEHGICAHVIPKGVGVEEAEVDAAWLTEISADHGPAARSILETIIRP